MKLKTHNLDTLLEYDNICISNIYYTNFLDITLDNTLYQKTHKDQISPKLSSACWTIGVLKQMLPHKILVMVHYDYFHWIMNNGTFWEVIFLIASIFFGCKRK
jgi:hypothetical protein